MEELVASEKSPLETLKLEELQNVSTYISKLSAVWNDFGLSDEQELQRCKVVWKHIHNLLQDILEEELSFYKDVKERIDNYTRKIEVLSKELSLAPKEDSSKSLIKKEENLRLELDSLTKLKHKRLKAYHELRSVESIYCSVLGVKECQLSSFTGVPSENDLREIDNHIHVLTKERDRRHKKFCLVKKELTTILETTELSPETSFEKEILSSDSDGVSLTDETFQTLEKVVCKAQSRKAELISKQKLLLDKLTTMWDRLGISESERIQFLSRHMDCKLSTLNSIQKELETFHKVKYDVLKKDLKQMWDRCYVSEAERKAFTPFYTDEVTEEIVVNLEEEIEKWRNYYKEAEHLLAKIEKRKELWDLLVLFDNNSSDPNRFKNRRCNLLKEEKERKKLQKDLPALENEIFEEIDLYEVTHDKSFLYYGEDYRSFVANQWQERNYLKDNKKKTRYMQRLVEAENGGGLKTPVKKSVLRTPKSAPCKVTKADIVMEASVYYTPDGNIPNITPVTVKKRALSPCKPDINCKLFPSLTPIKSIDKRQNNQEFNCLKDSNTTTYSEFEQELNSTDMAGLRSSVLLAKTPDNAKEFKPACDQKENVKTLKNTLCNVFKKSPNSTPVRGKLDLPFLM